MVKLRRILPFAICWNLIRPIVFGDVVLVLQPLPNVFRHVDKRTAQEIEQTYRNLTTIAGLKVIANTSDNFRITHDQLAERAPS